MHLSSLLASQPQGQSETPWSIFGEQNPDFLVSFQRAPTRQRERDEEQSEQALFLAKLSDAITVADAKRVLAADQSRQSGIGRRRRSNLAHVLQAFIATQSQPPFRVDERQPLPPSAATADECHAYRALVARLAEANEISQVDAEAVIQRLSQQRHYVDLL